MITFRPSVPSALVLCTRGGVIVVKARFRAALIHCRLDHPSQWPELELGRTKQCLTISLAPFHDLPATPSISRRNLIVWLQEMKKIRAEGLRSDGRGGCGGIEVTTRALSDDERCCGNVLTAIISRVCSGRGSEDDCGGESS